MTSVNGLPVFLAVLVGGGGLVRIMGRFVSKDREQAKNRSGRNRVPKAGILFFARKVP